MFIGVNLPGVIATQNFKPFSSVKFLFFFFSASKLSLTFSEPPFFFSFTAQFQIKYVPDFFPFFSPLFFFHLPKFEVSLAAFRVHSESPDFIASSKP